MNLLTEDKPRRATVESTRFRLSSVGMKAGSRSSAEYAMDSWAVRVPYRRSSCTRRQGSAGGSKRKVWVKRGDRLAG